MLTWAIAWFAKHFFSLDRGVKGDVGCLLAFAIVADVTIVAIIGMVLIQILGK